MQEQEEQARAQIEASYSRYPDPFPTTATFTTVPMIWYLCLVVVVFVSGERVVFVFGGRFFFYY